MFRIHSVFALATMILIAACGGDDPTQPNEPEPPPPVVVTSVELTPVQSNVYVGKTKQLTAVPKDAAGKAITGRSASWTSAKLEIATVTPQGIVTGVAVGDTKIMVTIDGKSAEATLAVQQVPVAAVLITPPNIAIKYGETMELVASPRDADNNILAGRSVRWFSSDTNVAKVDSITGMLTTKDGGTATVTAKSENATGQAAVNVQMPVHTVTVVASDGTLEAWNPQTQQVVLRDAKGRVLNGRPVVWSVSNVAVATIATGTGNLTGIDRGTVTVTATSEGKSGSAPVVIVIRYRSVVAGTMHACDIASGGIVWCWGLNGTQGRIGSNMLGDNSFSASPVRVPNTGPGALKFTQLSSYGTFTCGLTVDGLAYCWGYNGWSQLGIPGSTPSSYTPVAVSGGHIFTQISTGAEHACALTLDGRAYCWGHNDWKQFGTNNPGSSSLPVEAVPQARFRSISAGSNFTCGAGTSSLSYCWGGSGLGQLGDGTQISYGNTFSVNPRTVFTQATFSTIDAGHHYACALTVGGQAFCWGANGGKLGNNTTAESSVPGIVSGGITFNSVVTGNGHTCGVANDAALWCWGANGNGRLGTDLLNGSTIPVRAGGALKFSEVGVAGVSTGSGAHTCAVSENRLTVYCFGRNDFGQLGNGQTTSDAAVNSTPVVVTGQRPN